MGDKIIAFSNLEGDKIRSYRIRSIDTNRVASELLNWKEENIDLHGQSGNGSSASLILATKIMFETLWFALRLVNNICHIVKNVFHFYVIGDTKKKLMDIFSKVWID